MLELEWAKLALIAGLILAVFIIVAIIITKMYRRASKETAFVKTGMGGQKVIMDGGAVIIPIIHETIPVNMNTLRLAVQRANEQALITRDRMRVDVVAEFYVRVRPQNGAIAAAAQTLGRRTMQPAALKELIEGKFVDALRSVAAEMTMEELHEKRVDFVQKVQQVVTEDLAKNGLELESVSLTGLDQTPIEYFNPNNAFDAEGLTRLTEEIEARRKIRNDIEQDTTVKIQMKDLEAEKKKLTLSKEKEYAKLEQSREIEIRRAEQAAEVQEQQAARKREAEQARIEAQRQVNESKIEAERSVEQAEIDKALALREKEISKDRAIETQQIDKQRAVKLAEQVREIAIAEKSKEQSLAAAEADAARAKAVQAEEMVITSRQQEAANREKTIELIEATKAAEKEAIGVKVSAEAAKISAADRAEAVRELARAEADKVRIQAEADAEAEKIRSAAAEIRFAVDAAGQVALNEAANLLSDKQISMQVKMKMIENLENIITASARPMEQIKDIRIVQLDGLHGGGGSRSDAVVDTANGSVAPGGGSLADQVVSSALRYRAQAPLVDNLLSELGLTGSDLQGLSGGGLSIADMPETGNTGESGDVAPDTKN
ncbi:MAG: flotillin family protein [Alphaproteobacteria bacterium]